MGCSSCSSGGKPAGCRSKGYCSKGDCEKLEVFDWLSNMRPPLGVGRCEVVTLRFKNGRKEFFRNDRALPLRTGEAVVVPAPSGHDIGTVSLTGALVYIEMRRRDPDLRASELPALYRRATEADLQSWERARAREHLALLQSRSLAAALGLEMKLSDVEYQADGTRATFYYTAEERIDFRQLLKGLTHHFRIRIAMKQIGYRHEAARLGGLGSCGRELCCSTWLTDFRAVSTTAVRYQQLSINPQKLLGQCGKLKCCLNYELDTYVDALKEFPDTKIVLQTQKGKAHFQKLDIFQQYLWYAYEHEPLDPIRLSLSAVREILSRNQAGEPIAALEEFAETPPEEIGELEPEQPDPPTERRNKRRRARRQKKNPKNGKGR